MANSDKTTPLVIHRRIDGIPEGLPPEEVERIQDLQSKLTSFVLSLIQAFLRTGYYTSDHPESKKGKGGALPSLQGTFWGGG